MDFKQRLYTCADDSIGRFYKSPKVFTDCKFYRDLSLGARYMYEILLDRQNLSVVNKWIDKNGYFYFYFDCEKLSDILNISTSTVNKYKQELMKHFLLINVRQGQGKPNRMYILKPEDVDYTLISENHYSSIAKNAYLEMQKSLCNDTEYSETERIRLNMIQFDSDQIGDYVKIYDSLYFDYKNKKHPLIPKESVIDIQIAVSNIIESIDDRNDFYNMVESYFEQLPENNNGNILSFIKASIRYLVGGDW